ncbi:MAG TPA: 4-(cytidine 5'-diphospho)-2-C-methyl-D-erythritol kinase [Burkholderiaceae bacterium]|nr:4-(cytidine 5'-diphospho)-2-C-methyl-D-erythritol kinase [Burkholderiaceae bacterium]
MSRLFLAVPAPAKLNLFLHVTGRRVDGYHELQSVFVPIDLADLLDFARRDDGVIERTGDLLGEEEDDLARRAAVSLQEASGTHFGARINVDKRIPPGSGMGGGSSDAASTLIALNRLWSLCWPRARLSELAVALGADVPFFLGPGPAFVEGIGERLTPLAMAVRDYAVVLPQVAVSTREIFADPGLTRDTKATIIAAFSAAQATLSERLFGANDLEVVVRRRFPEVDSAVRHLQHFGPARLTGSGSAVFMAARDRDHAAAAIEALPPGWRGWTVRSLAEHPLAAW